MACGGKKNNCLAQVNRENRGQAGRFPRLSGDGGRLGVANEDNRSLFSVRRWHHDAVGNVTNDGFHSYMYDDENRLTGVDVSPGSPPTPGTGTVTISGAEQKKNNCLAPVGGFSSPGASPQSCPWIYDYGSVSITINGYRQSVPYSQGSTASGIASGLINAFNGDPASPVTASGGTTITFTSKQVGSGSNYAFSTSVTYDTRDFTQASFAATPTSGTLTGGTNGTPPGTPNYFYDAEGRRIRKTTAGGTVDYIYDLTGHVVAEVSSAGGWNRGEVYAGGRHLATYMGGTGGTTYFTFADWLGNERVRTNPDGSIYSTWTNLPFDEGSSSPNPGTTHFTGKERDQESGNDNFGARYYGSNMGRWMSPDWAAKATAVPYAMFGDPQTLNLYSFVGDNPLSHVDLDGHQDGDGVEFSGPNTSTQAGAQTNSSSGGFFQELANFLGGNGWETDAEIQQANGAQNNIDNQPNPGPNPYVTAATDVAGIVAAVSDNAKLGAATAVISLANDHSAQNIMLTGAGFVPELSVPSAFIGAEADLLGFVAQDVMEGMINAIPGEKMSDGNGQLIPNPGLMDECDVVGCK